MSSPHLSDEIIINILSRLPAKFIGRCRCLSKSWRAMLSTPHFIKTHLTHLKKLPQESLCLAAYPFSCLTFTHAKLLDEIAASSTRLKIAGNPDSWKTIFGSCHGLVLIGDGKNKMFLINPTTREIRGVPTSPFTLNPSPRRTVYGFGYDLVNGDYKIVSLAYYYHAKDDPLPNNMVVQIYSVNDNTWKRGESSPNDLNLSVNPKTSGVLVDSCIHWLAHRNTDHSLVIAAFNLEEEKLYEVPPYSTIGHNRHLDYRHQLEVFNSRLCISSNQFSVWMMEEYGVHESWTKIVTFESKEGWFRPLCLFRQQNLILKYEEMGGIKKLVTYDLKKKTFKDVNIFYGIMDINNFTSWVTFQETLVSPHCGIEVG